MLPITHIELAHFSMSAVDDKRVLVIVGVKVIIVDGVDWFHFGI